MKTKKRNPQIFDGDKVDHIRRTAVRRLSVLLPQDVFPNTDAMFVGLKVGELREFSSLLWKLTSAFAVCVALKEHPNKNREVFQAAWKLLQQTEKKIKRRFGSRFKKYTPSAYFDLRNEIKTAAQPKNEPRRMKPMKRA